MGPEQAPLCLAAQNSGDGFHEDAYDVETTDHRGARYAQV